MGTDNPGRGSNEGHVFDGAADILRSDLQRLDELAETFGLNPGRDFVGMRMRGAEFVGTPEKPFDLRGWNLTRCDLSGARFENVVVDETTVFDEADLTDIVGEDSEKVLAVAPAAGPGPR